jgi:hypothetical protein
VNQHPAAAVLTGGDLTGEVEVLHRVVLGVHGEVVATRIAGQTAWHRPGREHPLVLQAQVPVQAAGVVLLDDEAGGVGVGAGRQRALRRHRLGRAGRVPPSPVLVQPVGHTGILRQTGPVRWMPECPVRSAAGGAAG